MRRQGWGRGRRRLRFVAEFGAPGGFGGEEAGEGGLVVGFGAVFGVEADLDGVGAAAGGDVGGDDLGLVVFALGCGVAEPGLDAVAAYLDVRGPGRVGWSPG